MDTLAMDTVVLLAAAFCAGGWLRSRDDGLGFAGTTIGGAMVLATLMPTLFVLGLPRGAVLATAGLAAACGAVMHARHGVAPTARSLVVALALAVPLVTPILLATSAPPLRYDALSIWWPKVLEVSSGGATVLQTTLDTPLQMHAEYPRGLAWLSSLAWRDGAPDPRWIKLLGVLFAWLTALLMTEWARAEGRPWTGGLAALLLLLLPDVAMWSHAGYADLPLAAAVLLAGIALGRRDRSPQAAVVAAAAGAGAASIKQEGVVVLLAVLAVLAVDVLRDRRAVRRLAGGAVAVLVLAPWYWMRAGEPGEVLSATSDVLTSPELLLSRVVALAEALGRFLVDPTSVWSGGGANTAVSLAAWTLLASIVVLVPRGRRPVCTWPAVALLAAILAVYVVTSKDLNWHVHTAFRRLVLQPLPLMLLAAVARLVESGSDDDTHAGPGTV